MTMKVVPRGAIAIPILSLPIARPVVPFSTLAPAKCANDEITVYDGGGNAIIPEGQVSSLIRRSGVLNEWPTVEKALSFDVLPIAQFVNKRVIIPVHEPVLVQRDAVRNERT